MSSTELSTKSEQRVNIEKKGNKFMSHISSIRP